MHVDIISPKYHPLRQNRNKFITAYRTRTYMLHADNADAAARTSANITESTPVAAEAHAGRVKDSSTTTV